MRLLLPVLAATAFLAGCHDYPEDERPNLYFATGPTVQPLDPVAGEQFGISFRVGNYGRGGSPSTQWRITKVGGAVIAVGSIPALGRYETSGDISIYLTETAGTWTYRIDLDQAGFIDETFKSDNEALVTLSVLPTGAG